MDERCGDRGCFLPKLNLKKYGNIHNYVILFILGRFILIIKKVSRGRNCKGVAYYNFECIT